MSDLIDNGGYRFWADDFSIQSAYEDCKAVFDGITDDDAFQECDTGIILYHAHEIMYALKKALPSAQLNACENTCDFERKSNDMISRQGAIDAFDCTNGLIVCGEANAQNVVNYINNVVGKIKDLPSAQPERVWHPVEKPPAHHKDVIVRGVEAIGNVTVHKVMQWDVDTWRPTDYAPSIMWTEWSEI